MGTWLQKVLRVRLYVLGRNKKQGIRGGSILNRLVREGLTGQVTFEQRSERDEGGVFWLKDTAAAEALGWRGLALLCTCLSASPSVAPQASHVGSSTCPGWLSGGLAGGHSGCLCESPDLCCPECQPLATCSFLNFIKMGNLGPQSQQPHCSPQ